MSVGGKSFHKKDWAKVGAGIGLGAAAYPLLGGLLGSSAAAGAAGAGVGGAAVGEPLALGGIAGMGAPMASMFGPTASGAALNAAFAPSAIPSVGGIAFDALAGGVPSVGMPALGTGAGLASSVPAGGLSSYHKAKFFMDMAKGFDEPKKQAQPAQRPQVAPINESDVQALLKKLFEGQRWA